MIVKAGELSSRALHHLENDGRERHRAGEGERERHKQRHRLAPEGNQPPSGEASAATTTMPRTMNADMKLNA